MRDIVAIILTCGIMFFMLANTRMGYWLFPLSENDAVPTDVVIEGWFNIVNVIVGALAGYMVGKFGGDK